MGFKPDIWDFYHDGKIRPIVAAIKSLASVAAALSVVRDR